MIKAIATNKFKERNLRLKEIGRIPEQGELLELTEERFKFLSKENSLKEEFVKEYVEEPVEEKEVKREELKEAVDKLMEEIDEEYGITEEKPKKKKKTIEK